MISLECMYEYSLSFSAIIIMCLIAFTTFLVHDSCDTILAEGKEIATIQHLCNCVLTHSVISKFNSRNEYVCGFNQTSTLILEAKKVRRLNEYDNNQRGKY